MRPPESFVGQPIRSLQTMLQVIARNDEATQTLSPMVSTARKPCRQWLFSSASICYR